MKDRVIIYNTDIYPEYNKARIARRKVIAAAETLGVECDCRLTISWVIGISKSDREAFIQLAKEQE